MVIAQIFIYRLSKSLVDLMTEKRVDLIVLEGMGRALHTNLYAKFKCESLKVAVVKNRWLATRLGGDMFSVIFKYEKGNSINMSQTAPTDCSKMKR